MNIFFVFLALKGEGCVIPDDFVKLDFEIAVDQQTRDRDRTFEGFRTPGAHQCRWPNFFEDLNQKICLPQ